MSGNKSYLDVDNINVRSGLPVEEYITITYDKLYALYSSDSLTPNKWYLISDFQNHSVHSREILYFSLRVLQRID